jgi:hypothetical protein
MVYNEHTHHEQAHEYAANNSYGKVGNEQNGKKINGKKGESSQRIYPALYPVFPCIRAGRQYQLFACQHLITD